MNKKNMQPERMKTEEDVHLKKKKKKKRNKTIHFGFIHAN